MLGLGFLLIMWGALDWGMSTSGTDVYYDWLGITVPDSVYTFTPWIAMVAGSMFVAAGRRS